MSDSYPCPYPDCSGEISESEGQSLGITMDNKETGPFPRSEGFQAECPTCHRRVFRGSEGAWQVDANPQ
jgi:hypothetical protein